MVSIYLIEDINDLKYVGSTTMKLYERLSCHRSDKKSGKNCSSSKLNLYNCIITQLESCDLEQRKERERYYINEIDCVNQRKLNGVDKDKQKEYRQKNKDKNKDKYKDKKKEYYQNNKETIKEYQKIDWFCSHCKCNVKRCNKSQHLKTKKHQLNTTNYLRDKNP